MPGPETYGAQRVGRTEATVLLGAALAVLVLYGIGLAALGTPPGAADTGGSGLVPSASRWRSLVRMGSDRKRATIRRNACAVTSFAANTTFRCLPYRCGYVRGDVCRAGVVVGWIGTARR